MSGKRTLQRTRTEGRKVRNAVKALHDDGLTNDQIAFALTHFSKKPTAPTYVAEIGTGRYRPDKKRTKALLSLTPERVRTLMNTDAENTQEETTPVAPPPVVPVPETAAKESVEVDPVMTPTAYSDTPRNAGQTRRVSSMAVMHRLTTFGFKQKDISEALDAHFTSVSGWSTGKAAPSAQTYTALYTFYQNVLSCQINPPEKCKPIRTASKYKAVSKDKRRESTMRLMLRCLQGMEGTRVDRMEALFDLSNIAVHRQMAFLVGTCVPHGETYGTLLDVLALVESPEPAAAEAKTEAVVEEPAVVTVKKPVNVDASAAQESKAMQVYRAELERLSQPSELGELRKLLCEGIAENLSTAMAALAAVQTNITRLEKEGKLIIGGRAVLDSVPQILRAQRDQYLSRSQMNQGTVGTPEQIAALKTLLNIHEGE